MTALSKVAICNDNVWDKQGWPNNGILLVLSSKVAKCKENVLG